MDVSKPEYSLARILTSQGCPHLSEAVEIGKEPRQTDETENNSGTQAGHQLEQAKNFVMIFR